MKLSKTARIVTGVVMILVSVPFWILAWSTMTSIMLYYHRGVRDSILAEGAVLAMMFAVVGAAFLVPGASLVARKE